MKVAITAQGKTVDSQVDPRFGRAVQFVVVDTDTDEFQTHDNSVNVQAASGAGVQAAKALIDLGVGAVITGNIGPKAMEVLQAANLDIYAGVTGAVQDALQRLKADELTPILRPNVKAHWS